MTTWGVGECKLCSVPWTETTYKERRYSMAKAACAVCPAKEPSGGITWANMMTFCFQKGKCPALECCEDYGEREEEAFMKKAKERGVSV